MTRTSCIVSFGSDALAIRDDGIIFTVVQGGLQPFGHVESLQLGLVPSVPYATYEPDFWLLDGNYKFAPDANARGGWVSTGMSAGSAGFDFGTDPLLKLVFDNVHSTDGLTLHFSEHSGDYADSITVAFYDSSDVLIRTDNYSPSATVFETNQAVSNFKRIDITALSTNRASRYARLMALDFDAITQFTGEQVKAAKVIQQIDPLSIELSIDTLELTLFSEDGDFSIVAPAGFYANLQYKEPLDVYEDMGDVIYIGRFYLDEWESISENEATFKASDAIGLLDKNDFLIPEHSPGDLLSEDIIDYIMDAVGIGYELDISLEGIDVAGTYPQIFPVISCRDALQNVLFAVGAYATCARSNVVRIVPLVLAEDVSTEDHALTSAEKGISSPLVLRPLVTGIQLLTHDHINAADGAPQEVFSDTFAVGEHTVIYERPANTLESGTVVRTILAETNNYITINVTSGGTYILEETNYFREVTTSKSLLNGSLPANTPPNIVVINDAFLVRPANVDTIIQRVYDYYAQRYLQKTRLFAHPLAPGDSIFVDVQSGRQMIGIVERMETDLAGGFVSDVEIIGVII